MPVPLLATKLYVPRPRDGAVARPRLLARLDEGAARTATLVSAPAGYGKTTLVASWVAARPRPVAWLALDPADRDPARLRTYLAASLDAHADGVDADLRALARTAPGDEVLAALAQEVAARVGPFAWVLDDVHLVDAADAEAVLAFQLEHLPVGAHLVLITREDPALPLARLRARDALTEVRVADLRFTEAEAAAFLRTATGRPLSDAEVAALDARTEGWAAALQLAAVSLRGREDVAGFVAGFAGSHRFVADYLIEEVLHQQPAEVQDFLVRTSLLERLNGPLCDAVTGRPAGDGVRTLVALERADLLLVPLDDTRTWYRYHHLLADVLRARLRERHSDQEAALHGRASAWYEAHGFAVEAVHHALAAGEPERAAALVEGAWSDVHDAHGYGTVDAWLRALPDDLVRARPGLAVAAGWTALMQGRTEAVAPRFDDAERALADGGRSPAAHAALAAAVAAGRAYLAQALGDVEATRAHAQRVLDLGEEGAGRWRGVAATLLAIAAWRRGDLATAERAVADTFDGWLAAGRPLEAVSVTYVHASVLVAQGRLRDASAAYERALRIAEEALGPGLPVDAAELLRGYADLARKRGDLEGADRRLARARDVAVRGVVPDWRHRFGASEALLALSRGDLDGAAERLEEAGRDVVATALPVLQPLEALLARVRLRQGRWREAWAWAEASGLALDAPLRYGDAHRQLTVARVHVARHAVQPDAAALSATTAALSRWVDEADAAGYGEAALDARVALAAALDAGGERAAALAVLEAALAAAEPEGHVGVFLDEGPTLAPLLGAAAAQGARPAFVAAIRAAAVASARAPRTGAAVGAGRTDGIEPLTDREADVLRLIAEGRSNQEIADRLDLALSTVKGYVRNVFGKLLVQRRTEAVARARDAGLID